MCAAPHISSVGLSLDEGIAVDQLAPGDVWAVIFDVHF
jgi:hypothetical protein